MNYVFVLLVLVIFFSLTGPIQPLLDIDLGVRFQKDATLTFVLCGVKEFQETVSVLQPVGKLRTMVAERLAIPWK